MSKLIGGQNNPYSNIFRILSCYNTKLIVLFNFHYSRMESIRFQTTLFLVLIFITVSSPSSVSCQQKKLRCQSDSLACLKKCTQLTQCEACRKTYKQCSTMCTTTKKHSKKQNIKKIKRKIKKLLKLL